VGLVGTILIFVSIFFDFTMDYGGNSLFFSFQYSNFGMFGESFMGLLVLVLIPLSIVLGMLAVIGRKTKIIIAAGIVGIAGFADLIMLLMLYYVGPNGMGLWLGLVGSIIFLSAYPIAKKIP
jgi:hypothetical protein